MTNRVSHAAGLRRGLMACCALLVLGAAAPALAQEPAAPPVAFTLPTQPLDLALPAFAKQADVQVLYASNLVKGKRANAVIGTRPPAEALRDLLAGSGLKATATGPRTFLISAQENPVVAELEEVIVTAQKRSARALPCTTPSRSHSAPLTCAQLCKPWCSVRASPLPCRAVARMNKLMCQTPAANRSVMTIANAATAPVSSW